MDEDFIQKALHMMGEVNILSIKVIKNKFTGGAAGYGFINFISDQVALTCMHKLNGKIMPNTNPPIRFKLNHNSNRLLPGEKNHSIWVGDLTPEVDDLQLYRFFSARFQSIVSAKVVLDDSGFSKGFGFIRFGNEQEQQTAMTSMMGVSGLGGKPIKVSIAVQKTKMEDNSMDIPAHLVQHVTQSVTGGNSSSHHHQPGQGGGEYGGGDYGAQQQPQEGGNYGADYYNQYNQYWSQYAAWQQYQQQYAAWEQQQAQSNNSQPANAAAAPPGPPGPPPAEKPKKSDPHSLFVGPVTQLVEHKKVVDVKEENKVWMEKSDELWSSVEESGWWYVGQQ